MFKLYTWRVIQSVGGWQYQGEFESLDWCVDHLINRAGFWLDAKAVGEDGTEYKLAEGEVCDEDGQEYVNLYFTSL